MPPYLPLLVGACCALCAAIPTWLWSRQVDKIERLQRELWEAHKTIQRLHSQFGMTKTTIAPWNRKGSG